MNRQERADIIFKHLAKFYPQTPIPLKHKDKDPFTLLIAVLLSAQCTDVRVNLVTPQLFAQADTPEKMLQLGEKKILKLIRTCGLAPTKAKNIILLSQRLLSEYQGKVPSDFESLESLAGVGHKTASVVMAQAFGIPAMPVDTHIHRLAKRWKLSKGKNVIQTEKDLKKLYSKNKWNSLHLRMVFYGREYCTARGCDGKTCLICQKVNN